MYSSNLTIKNNKFTQNYGASNYGLLLKEIKDSYFEKNEFYENTNGIYLENSINNNFYSNIFKRNKFSIRIMANCENNYFKGNFFIDNLFEVLTNSITTFNNKFLRNYWDKYIGYDRNKGNIGDEPYRIVKMSSFLFENYKISIILLNSPLLSFLEFIEKLIPSISLNIYDYEPILKYGHS
jgi:nitrous oxidase accessory protein